MIKQYKNSSVMEVLPETYIFRDCQAVRHFLEQHPFLVPLLSEAHDAIQHYFGSSTPLALEVFTDPEVVGDQQLVALIQTDLPPAEALAKLDRFDKDWWLAASHESKGKLCIHLEYQ
jgi:hypothetical protein